MDKGYFDINLDIVSKLKLPEGVLRHKPRHSVEAHGHVHGHSVHKED